MFAKNEDLQKLISSHPIFADVGPVNPPDEYVRISSLVSIIDPKHNVNFTGFGANDSGVKNIVAVRGTEIFVAVHGQIRCTDGARIRESGNHLRFYKTLNITGLDFTVRSLQINNLGTYMAIVGDSTVIACALPLPGFSKRSEARLHVRHRKLRLDSREGGVSVLKAIWHPLAKEGSCLLVLSSDKIVSFEEPDQVYDFTQTRGNSSFSFSQTMHLTPVSMCFGVQDQGLGEMALYVLMEDGDIYALCPFIPRQCVMEKGSILVLLEWALAEDRDAGPEVSRLERFRARQQLSWVVEIAMQSNDQSRVAGMMPRTGKYGELADFGGFDRPDPAKFKVKLQGPISIRPYPKALYKSGLAWDIAAYDAEDQAIFAVAFSSGRVNLLLQDVPAGAVWDTTASNVADEDEPETDASTFLLLESIGLDCKLTGDKSGQCLPFWFLPSPPDGNSIFIAYAERVIQLDIAGWKRQLVSLTSGTAEPQKQLQTLPKTKIVSLFKSDNFRVLAVAIIDDQIHGELLLILTTEGLCVCDSGLQETSFLTASSNNAVFQSDDKSDMAPISYETPYRQSSFDIDMARLKRGSALEAKILQKARELGPAYVDRLAVSEDTLKFFGDAVEIFGSDLKYVHSAGFKIHSRLVEQMAELHRQLSVVSELAATINSRRYQDTSANVQKVLDRQKELNDRTDKLYHRLMESQELPISQAEAKWMRELNRIRATLEEPRGLAQRARIASDQTQKLTAMVDAIKQRATEPQDKVLVSGLQRERVELLRDMLENEARLISKTKSSLEGLVEKVESKFAGISIENS